MEFTGDILSAIATLVFYGITLIPAFVVGTYIIGREKEKRFSTKQVIALSVAFIPFLLFILK